MSFAVRVFESAVPALILKAKDLTEAEQIVNDKKQLIPKDARDFYNLMRDGNNEFTSDKKK